MIDTINAQELFRLKISYKYDVLHRKYPLKKVQLQWGHHLKVVGWQHASWGYKTHQDYSDDKRFLQAIIVKFYRHVIKITCHRKVQVKLTEKSTIPTNFPSSKEMRHPSALPLLTLTFKQRQQFYIQALMEWSTPERMRLSGTHARRCSNTNK